MQSFDSFVSALEQCFDFHSARVIAKDAVASAGLQDREEWSDDDLKRVAAHLPAARKSLTPVLQKLGLGEASA